MSKPDMHGEEESFLSAARKSCDPAELESLRDRSVGRMQSPEFPTADRLRWAQVALSICRAKHACGAVDDLTAATEVARVRSYTIRQFGPARGDHLRDPFQLYTDVTEAIGETSEEIRRKSAHWQHRTREEILHLRRVKNLLNTLEGVQEQLRDQSGFPERDMQAWLDLLPLLP
ncbi:hypothetical protein [Streptomyces spirodelae]|uniref:Uncharacterized protein n=1 Tax=Streptomyces spirodelae TaxID=2812904 RepID=A0ABS3WYG6_9ACTN|nr:hypothetical protein [Streptomyces spirodelae]MBO8188175.1 hypothetical protein [Streptomyces spirodelae]